jgi:hypothetical protein
MYQFVVVPHLLHSKLIYYCKLQINFTISGFMVGNRLRKSSDDSLIVVVQITTQ